jgi:hypothetical protein
MDRHAGERSSTGAVTGSRIHGESEELTVMRRQLITLTLAGLAIATTASGSSSAASDDSSVQAAPAVPVQRAGRGAPPMRDEAAMVLVGTVLIGLGAAVRRAI